MNYAGSGDSARLFLAFSQLNSPRGSGTVMAIACLRRTVPYIHVPSLFSAVITTSVANEWSLCVPAWLVAHSFLQNLTTGKAKHATQTRFSSQGRSSLDIAIIRLERQAYRYPSVTKKLNLRGLDHLQSGACTRMSFIGRTARLGSVLPSHTTRAHGVLRLVF